MTTEKSNSKPITKEEIKDSLEWSGVLGKLGVEASESLGHPALLPVIVGASLITKFPRTRAVFVICLITLLQHCGTLHESNPKPPVQISQQDKRVDVIRAPRIHKHPKEPVPSTPLPPPPEELPTVDPPVEVSVLPPGLRTKLVSPTWRKLPKSDSRAITQQTAVNTQVALNNGKATHYTTPECNRAPCPPKISRDLKKRVESTDYGSASGYAIFSELLSPLPKDPDGDDTDDGDDGTEDSV